ncbi:MAG: hypothetical protein KKA62_01860 [Nanoarchaeota archaeon]|nr:hypothetical protein [Nanoarchaeota archaeon]MBU1643827.1 hypothetical protein [Nanoarchaeota archaeon]MBU1976679.1 hypothetical protein [Nanoarchaeota archaeon]
MELIKPCKDLGKEFHDFVEHSIQARDLDISSNAKIYLVGVLVNFSTSGNILNEYDSPLTFKLHESMNEKNKIVKIGKLQDIGDLCLFLTGYFPDYIQKKGEGQIDYHIGIGSTAYKAAGEFFGADDVLYKELSEKFPNLRLVVGDLRPRELYNNLSLDELYERWKRTRDSYESSLLINKGVIPIIGNDDLN